MKINYEDFEKVDIRLGKVIKVEDFPEAKKPALKLWIDLGEEIGIKKSSAQIIPAHTKEELLNSYVFCVVNFSPRQVGPFISEVLTLGVANSLGSGYVLIEPKNDNVAVGSKLL
jgi:tRNA-binding protein